MKLTRSKAGGGATNVDELKKQASAAAVAKAVEVIKAGGTQAEAAAAAKGVARDILAKGQQQMLQKPPVSNKKSGGLMGKLRKNKNKKENNKAVASKPMKNPAATALPSTATLQRTGTVSPDPESVTTGSRTDSRSESSGDAASSYSSSSGRVTEDDGTAPSKGSSKESSSSSKPSLYLDESLAGTNEDMSYITEGNTSRSTIHITDMLNMGNVMKAIDTALEEKDIEREMRGGKKHWIDRILDCDMCLGVESSDNSFVSSGSGDGTILSKDAPSVLSASGRGSNNGGGGGGNNALETVEEEKDTSDSASADAATKAKDSSPSSSDSKTEAKSDSSAEAQAKLDQSGSVKKTSDASVSAASGAQTQLRSGGSKSPVTVNSKSNSTKSGGMEDDSLSLNPVVPTPWKQLLGIAQGAAPSATPNKQESTQATQPKPVEKQVQQVPQQQVQQQQPEERQDANLDWRSQVTDEAPNPNPKLANRAATYDPKKSNPSVFIPPTAQPTPQAEFINFGATGYGSPMNGQGYGYGGSPPGSPQNYYPQHPTSPYGGNPASPYGQFPPGTNNIANIQGVTSLSLDDASAHSRVDRYGGDEDVMISDAAAKSKSQLEGAASFVYRVLSGNNGDGDAATVSTNDHEQNYKQEQQYGQYGGPPPMHYYPPPQQYHGGYSPHHQQQYPPQQQYQQHYPPQQQYPPQEQYQQNYPQQYPPTNIDPNPSSAAYYDQIQVSSPMHNQRFAT